MSQTPLLNRKETQTLLNTLKITTAAGAISLTLAGWGLLSWADMRHTPQTVVAANTISLPAPTPTTPALPTPAPTPIQSAAVIKLDVVQRTRSSNGDPVAVVRDKRGRLWYVMGSDVPRIEQGLQPQFQPQPVQIVTRTRSS